MSGEKPKLNLRGVSSSPVSNVSDTDVESLLSRLDEAKAAKQPPPVTRRVTKKQGLNSEFTTQSDSLLSRTKKPEADIGEVWDDLKARQIGDDESIIANREIGEVIDKVRFAIGGASKRLKSAYTKAATKDNQRPRAVERLRPRSSTQTTPNRSHKHKASKKQFPRISHKLLAMGALAFIGVFFVWNTIQSGDSSESSSEVGGVSTSQPQRTTNGEDVPGGNIVAVAGLETDFSLSFPESVESETVGIAVVSPPDAPPVYAFNDYLNDALLSVSQQEIPSSFQPDVNTSFENLAASFAATEKIVTNDKVTIFHGYTDKNDGVQSLMFMKNDLLIFISSTEKLADGIWADYIDSFDVN